MGDAVENHSLATWLTTRIRKARDATCIMASGPYPSGSAPGTLAHTIESKNHTEVTNRRSTDGGIDARTARAMSELFSAPWTSWREHE